MFEAFSLLLILFFIFGSLYLVFKATKGIKTNDAGLGVKVIGSFPISYKISGHIIKMGDKFYLCCESCGIIEIEHTADIDLMMNNKSFQSILANEFEKLKNIRNKKDVIK